jgi:hypothetical protein
MSELFLTPEDVAFMTGRKTSGRQIDTLRQMGVPFFVNAAGRPIVTKTAIGIATQAQTPTKPIGLGWQSNANKKQPQK